MTNPGGILSRLGACRMRTLVCVIAGTLAAGCKAQKDAPDSARTASTSSPSTATTVTSQVTYLSAMTVASGVFQDDSLIRLILDTARTLKPSDWDHVHDRIDERRLLSGGCAAGSKSCVPGPFARILARKNIHKTKPADLGKGHIVGKIENLEVDQAIPYTKLALYAGTPEAYWWIGTHVNPSDSSRTDTLSVYVPKDWSASKPAKWRMAGVRPSDPGNVTFAHSNSSARFLWNDNDDETWVSCVSNGCCQPPAGFDSTRAGTKAHLDSTPQ
jgi:hypothetical protein